jgi:CheY-like chemotaxis protein
MPKEISLNRHGVFGMIERARYLGGTMDIKSEAGNGTTAHLILPLGSAKQNKKKKVLLVDDDAFVRYALRLLLEDQTDDFSVEGEAEDGERAIVMVIKSEWDIVLLDINLPQMRGIEVLEEIKKIKPKLPVIMLSSHSKDKYAEIALSKGAACYLEKGTTDRLVTEMRRATFLQ